MTNCIVAGPPRSGAHQVSKFLSNKYKYAWAGEPTIRSRNTPPIHVFKRIQQFKNTSQKLTRNNKEMMIKFYKKCLLFIISWPLLFRRLRSKLVPIIQR